MLRWGDSSGYLLCDLQSAGEVVSDSDDDDK